MNEWNFVKLFGLEDNEVIDFGDSLVKVEQFKKIIENTKYDFDKSLKERCKQSGMQTDFKVYEEYTINGDTRLRSGHRYFYSEDGVLVKALRVKGEAWEKGKIRVKVTVEFIPDEPEEVQPESLLDDIRQAQLGKSED